MMLALALAATIRGHCPFVADHWTEIEWKRDLPPDAMTKLGEMAEKGEPFQVSDVLPSGPHLPFSRIVSAQGRGCVLEVRYEHGGRGHSWLTAILRFHDEGWTNLSR